VSNTFGACHDAQLHKLHYRQPRLIDGCHFSYHVTKILIDEDLSNMIN